MNCILAVLHNFEKYTFYDVNVPHLLHYIGDFPYPSFTEVESLAFMELFFDFMTRCGFQFKPVNFVKMIKSCDFLGWFLNLKDSFFSVSTEKCTKIRNKIDEILSFTENTP